MIYCSSGLGEVSEWFKEPVLKTGDPERDRGFESHLLRNADDPLSVVCLYMCRNAHAFIGITEINLAWRSTQVAEGAPLERE